jgi:hypothetical protein
MHVKRDIVDQVAWKLVILEENSPWFLRFHDGCNPKKAVIRGDSCACQAERAFSGFFDAYVAAPSVLKGLGLGRACSSNAQLA